MKIRSILVVGGGSSGWMSAAAFSRYLKGIKVTVLESNTSSPIGVGESTMVAFNHFLKLIGLKDEDWMKYCDATYKTSVRFTNFRDKDSGSFEYPFGHERSGQDDSGRINAWAHLAAKYKLSTDSFCEFNNQVYFLARYNRLTKNENNRMNLSFNDVTAYHFDAKLFGEYLRDHVCKPEGVEHHYDDVVSVEKDSEGYITSVVGSSGEKYSADLYVDCTGFKSILLEGEMNSKFISSKKWLSNDSAFAARIPYTNKEIELENVTTCTAIENGWVWHTPLWSKIGTGYVYSSDFVDDETAEKEFKSHLGVEDIDLRKIKFRHGYHEKGWIKNVLGIGLSYAFVEPLEATGLSSTHVMIQRACELIEHRDYNVNGFDIDGYNYHAAFAMRGMKRFVALHYKFSSRIDTPYWRYQTEGKDWFNLDKDDDFYEFPVDTRADYSGYRDVYSLIHSHHSINHNWPSENRSYAYIMAGMGYKPFSKKDLNKVRTELDPDIDKRLESMYNEWRQYVDDLTEYVNTLPTSYEFLKENIYQD
tara:strand:- start:64 stop:1659 length:1596 start_codon:yes stop_codon:yes gene_type:complete